MKNITKAILGLLILTITSVSYGETVSFKYEANIIQSWGASGLAVGDLVGGEVTYVLNQTGHQVSLIVPGSTTRYVNGMFTANAHDQKIRSTGGQVEVKNDVEPFGTVVWDGIIINVSDRYGSIKVGDINGFKVMDLQILLTSLVGQPFTSTSLPAELDLANYPSSRRFLMTFEGAGGGVIGELTLLEPCTLNVNNPYRGCMK